MDFFFIKKQKKTHFNQKNNDQDLVFHADCLRESVKSHHLFLSSTSSKPHKITTAVRDTHKAFFF